MRLWPRIISAAITRVGASFGVLEEAHPSQIAFKLEAIQVHAVHRLDANTNKLLCQLGDVIILTDNLPVEI